MWVKHPKRKQEIPDDNDENYGECKAFFSCKIVTFLGCS